MFTILKDKGLLSHAGSENMEDIGFANKMEEENIQNRLATLFSKEDQLNQKATDKVASALDDPYLTVNEGLTTDTAMTTDSEIAAEENQQKAALNEALGGNKESSGEDKQEATGILSSDEEETQTSRSPAGQSQNQSQFNEKSMFGSEKEKE